MINVVGFAGATGSATVPLAATRIYQMAFFTGFGVASLIYWVLNHFFPVPGKSDKFEEIDHSDYMGAEHLVAYLNVQRDSDSFDEVEKPKEEKGYDTDVLTSAREV
jgi:NCS1 family nucleobase:cation symporter-1